MNKERLDQVKALINGGVGERTRAFVMIEMLHDGEVHFFTNGSSADVVFCGNLVSALKTNEVLGIGPAQTFADKKEVPNENPST